MHERFLKQTLELASRRKGLTGSNPAVGAVVVKDGTLLARGFHLGSGHPHAEVEALSTLGEEARHATVYVSLEPCCFVGRTPACTDLLISRGVAQVFYAYRDPNPRVSGKGEEALKRAGIRCNYLPTAEADRFYETYAHWTKYRTPWVTAKLALTLDGKIAYADGAPRAITGEEAAAYTHRGRKEAHVILTTAKTIRADDPQLNARLPDEVVAKPVYVLDARAEITPGAKIFRTASAVTIFHGPAARYDKTKFPASVTWVETPVDAAGRLAFDHILKYAGSDGCHELWVEAGGTIFESLVTERQLQRAILYVAPQWLGGRGKAAFSSHFDDESFADARHIEWTQMGDDARGEFRWGTK